VLAAFRGSGARANLPRTYQKVLMHAAFVPEPPILHFKAKLFLKTRVYSLWERKSYDLKTPIFNKQFCSSHIERVTCSGSTARRTL
jgi:hypothetical protein